MPARALYILVHFFAFYCKATTSNNQMKGFVENINTQRLNFFSLFNLDLQNLLDNPVTLYKLNKLEQLQSSFKIERILGVVVVVA